MDNEEEEIRQAWIGEVRERMKAVEEGSSILLDFDTFIS
ncbi:MAG: hypothetical protein HKK67_14725 [Chlorobiaceae bacterium]|nr:hypothetical protein [Chlorobiaceae bacterium]